MTLNRVTQRQLADQRRVTQGLIYQWLSGLRKVSAEKVLSVSEATEWQVTPHELRPDIYPNPTDGIPAEKVADLIGSGAIKPIVSPRYTQFSGSGSLYSASEHERRGEERRQEERREQERREGDRRH